MGAFDGRVHVEANDPATFQAKEEEVARQGRSQQVSFGTTNVKSPSGSPDYSLDENGEYIDEYGQTVRIFTDALGREIPFVVKAGPMASSAEEQTSFRLHNVSVPISGASTPRSEEQTRDNTFVAGSERTRRTHNRDNSFGGNERSEDPSPRMKKEKT